MKYLRALIILLMLVLIGIGGYYTYVKSMPSKSTNIVNTDEAPRPLQNIDAKSKSPVVSKYTNYTTQDSKNSGKAVTVKGVFQAEDGANKEINGITYTRVIGIVGEDGSLASVWLTSNEYEQIKDIVTKFGRHGESVAITLSNNVVNFATPNGSTKN